MLAVKSPHEEKSLVRLGTAVHAVNSSFITYFNNFMCFGLGFGKNMS